MTRARRGLVNPLEEVTWQVAAEKAGSPCTAESGLYATSDVFIQGSKVLLLTPAGYRRSGSSGGSGLPPGSHSIELPI